MKTLILPVFLLMSILNAKASTPYVVPFFVNWGTLLEIKVVNFLESSVICSGSIHFFNEAEQRDSQLFFEEIEAQSGRYFYLTPRFNGGEFYRFTHSIFCH